MRERFDDSNLIWKVFIMDSGSHSHCLPCLSLFMTSSSDMPLHLSKMSRNSQEDSFLFLLAFVYPYDSL